MALGGRQQALATCSLHIDYLLRTIWDPRRSMARWAAWRTVVGKGSGGSGEMRRMMDIRKHLRNMDCVDDFYKTVSLSRISPPCQLSRTSLIGSSRSLSYKIRSARSLVIIIPSAFLISSLVSGLRSTAYD